jgi:uncharacterized membrane protein YccF (DUF307 family)
VKKQFPEKGKKRRELYLIAGIIVGVTLITIPFIVHLLMGQISPFTITLAERPSYRELAITSPLDVVIEVFWLVLPAIFVILALYWIVNRRKRWAGYNEAVKWARH